MQKIEGKAMVLRFPEELHARMKARAKKEGRSLAEFVRRALDRYLLEAEFRGDALDPEARESIRKNKELLHLLRNS